MQVLTDIKTAVDAQADAFVAFKEKHNNTVAGIVDRIEVLEAGKAGPGRSGHADKTFVPFQSVIDHPKLKELASGTLRDSGEIKLESLPQLLKTLVSFQNDSSPTAGSTYAVQPQRLDQFMNDPRLALGLLRALPSMPIASNTLEFPRLSDSFDAEADYQGNEGATKAQLDPQSVMHTATVATIAHWVRTSRQVLSDVPALQRQLSSLLTYGVLKKTERELVNGSGGRNIEGLATIASPFSATATAPADRVGEAITALQILGWNPDLVVLHPTDYFAFASERASSGDGQYVAGGGWAAPADSGVWGMQKVLTPSLAPGTALVLDRSQTVVLDRLAATLLATSDGHDNLSRNLTTLLAEIRIGLAIFSPAAILKVDVSVG